MYQFTKLILSIFPTSNDKFDLLSIALFCITGNLSIFAFGYPYIYDAIEKLSEISKTISDKIRNYKRISWYKWGLGVIFASDLVFIGSIVFFDSLYKIYLYFSIIVLFSHIIWVMKIYKFIFDIKNNPFSLIYNKKIKYKDFWIVGNENINNKKGNNDDNIQLISDIILYKIKNDLDDERVGNVYIPYLIGLTAYKFDKILTDNKIDLIVDRLSKYVSSLGKMQYINQKIVQYKIFDKFTIIDSFFLILLRYQENLTDIDKNMKEKFPLLFNKLKNINEFNFPILKKNILETYYYVWLYRIENNCFRIYDVDTFFWLFYVVNSYNITISSDKNVCFDIITKLVDKDISSFYYKEIFEKFSHFVIPTYGLYNNIKLYHILVLSYLIFRNKYEIAYDYLKTQENDESNTEYVYPQIPNTINQILPLFIGKYSVFSNDKSFDINVSSMKYKFYTLFLMLLYSKKFAKKSEKILKNVDKKDWRYERIQNDIKFHSEFTLKMEDFFLWKDIFAFQYIKSYSEYLSKFKKEKLLIQAFEFEQKDIDFVETILLKVVNGLEETKQNLLNTDINELAKQPILSQAKNDENYNLKIDFNIKSNRFIQNLKNTLPFNFINDKKNVEQPTESFSIFEKIYDKEQFLSYGYESFYLADYFYPYLLDKLSDYCKNISDINELIDEDLNNFSVLSNIEYDFQFISLGVKKENLKTRYLSEGFSDVKVLVLDKKEIPISEKNRYFTSCVNNEESIVLIIDISAISISIGNEKEITFEELSKTKEIKISNDTKFNIYLKKDKIGYCIRKK